MRVTIVGTGNMARGVATRALAGGHRTRAQLAAELEAAGRPSSGLGFTLLVMLAELERVAISGANVGKQRTYAAFDERVRATALWYPTGLHDGKLGKDPDAGSLGRAAEIRGEMLLIFGTEDPHTPADGRSVIKRGLEDAGVSVHWGLYEAEHAFGRDIGPRYDPQATDAAFAETVGLLQTA